MSLRQICPRRLLFWSRLALPSIILIGVASDAAAAEITGTVVDRSGRGISRAFVRVTDNSGHELARGFADEAGRFTLVAPDHAGCRVEATLTGFQPAAAACAAEPLRLELAIAPVQETVLVSATRTDAPTSQVGASATVFTAEDLERRQAPFVTDLLSTTPGAMVLRSGGAGSLTSLFVRGGESDYNKVLLDGVPLNEPGGTFYLNNLTTENLERVEIVRGAYSALFGSDAMASVIQLFTRRGDRTQRRPRGSVQIDGGTYETLHLNASVSGGTPRVDYAAGIAQFNSDNRVPNSRLENTTLSGNLGVTLGAAATLRFIARGELEQAGTPGPTAFGRPDLDASFERDDSVASVMFDQQLTRTLRQRAAYSVAVSTQSSTNLILDPPYTATFEGRVATRQSTDFLNDTRGHLRRHHAGYQADWRLTEGKAAGTQLLTLLVDWDGERATQEDRSSGSETFTSRDNFGVSVQDQMLWRRVFVTAGARLEHNENFGTEVVPRGSLVYVARESSANVGSTRLKISAGTGIKEPTMLESFSISPFFLGNPDLKPERSRSVEAGLDQRFAADRAKLELTWFDNRFSEIISLRTNPATFEGQYFNVGVTKARGVEVGGEVVPAAAVRARAGYTFLDSAIVESTAPTNPLFAEGAWAFRRPRHSGSVGGTVLFPRTTVDINGVFVGRFVDSDFGLFSPPFTERPGHTTWDARVSVKLTTQVSAVLLVDNFTDRDYSEPLGYQPLRRVVRAGVRVGF
jgi:outer membrane cobalamin receptor